MNIYTHIHWFSALIIILIMKIMENWSLFSCAWAVAWRWNMMWWYWHDSSDWRNLIISTIMATPKTSNASQHNVMQHISPCPTNEKSSLPQTTAYQAPETTIDSYAADFTFFQPTTTTSKCSHIWHDGKILKNPQILILDIG